MGFNWISGLLILRICGNLSFLISLGSGGRGITGVGFIGPGYGGGVDDSVLDSVLESVVDGRSAANSFRRSKSSLGGRTTTGFSAESLPVSGVSTVLDFSVSALGSEGKSGADTGVVAAQPARIRLSKMVAPRTVQRPRINDNIMAFSTLMGD